MKSMFFWKRCTCLKKKGRLLLYAIALQSCSCDEGYDFQIHTIFLTRVPPPGSQGHQTSAKAPRGLSYGQLGCNKKRDWLTPEGLLPVVRSKVNGQK